jgi:histidinol-phosphatase (PHP family)
MTKIKDSHTHCVHSFDGTDSAEKMIEAALLAGADYIAVTDHHDLYLPYIPSQVALGRGGDFGRIDLKRHFATLQPLKERFAGKIEVAIGAEFGYIKEAEADFLQACKMPFDVIINSVHSAGYEDLYEDAYYDGKSKKQTYELFLQEVWQSLHAPYPFQIVGHLGYVERNAKYENRRLVYAEFPDLLDAILKKAAQDGKALEVNSHTKSLEFDYGPDITIIKRFKELGGQFVTFASDAHAVGTIGQKWAQAISAITSAGFKFVTSFMGQKPRMHEIR